jgi:hemerythrin
MDYAEWVRDNSVGDDEMDSYHRVFFEALEEATASLEPSRPAAAQERLGFLLMYARMHFEAEEQLLHEVGYPGLERHRTLHEAFRGELDDLHARMRDGATTEQARETLGLLRAWWADHIQHEDKDYAAWVVRRPR